MEEDVGGNGEGSAQEDRLVIYRSWFCGDNLVRRGKRFFGVQTVPLNRQIQSRAREFRTSCMSHVTRDCDLSRLVQSHLRRRRRRSPPPVTLCHALHFRCRLATTTIRLLFFLLNKTLLSSTYKLAAVFQMPAHSHRVNPQSLILSKSEESAVVTSTPMQGPSIVSVQSVAYQMKTILGTNIGPAHPLYVRITTYFATSRRC